MTQEEKELLLKDLCGRLRDGVKVHCEWNMFRGDRISEDGELVLINTYANSIHFKRNSGRITEIPFNRIDGTVLPYLRPMQSMTKGEKEEYRKLCKKVVRKLYVADGKSWPSNKTSYRYFGTKTEYYDTYQSIDYLISRHFDYRGLIGKKLALKATKGMYEF